MIFFLKLGLTPGFFDFVGQEYWQQYVDLQKQRIVLIRKQKKELLYKQLKEQEDQLKKLQREQEELQSLASTIWIA